MNIGFPVERLLIRTIGSFVGQPEYTPNSSGFSLQLESKHRHFEQLEFRKSRAGAENQLTLCTGARASAARESGERSRRESNACIDRGVDVRFPRQGPEAMTIRVK
jgi:hypothetical protein